MNKKEAYQELDKMLRDLMTEWGDKHKGEDLDVWTSGSVEFGEWHVYRNPHIFDGLKFKFSDKMFNEFVIKDKITLTHKDMINQKEYKEKWYK